MRIAVSNIAWTSAEEPEVAKELQKLGVKYVEIAPTKVWEDPVCATDEQIEQYRDFWAEYGIEVVAFQSMLFTRPNLKIFESAENRSETLQYLKKFIVLAGKMKAGAMVFGSPKNRQRGATPSDEAWSIAKKFFAELGTAAQEHSVKFCIEPNAPQYACDFITTAAEGIELVSGVNNPGFGLHLDIACMMLAGDNVTSSIRDAATLLRHFHISSPMLDLVEDREDVPHKEAGSALREIGYEGFVSVEMRPGESGTNLERVRTAVMIANKYYL
jgi:D-psicose/D-tagatose/L-ribulose 3-epimerase